MKDKGDLDSRLHLSRARATIAGACTGSTSEGSTLGPLSAAYPSREPPQASLASALPQCWERGKHTFKGDRASMGPTLRASAPAPWDQIPPPIGW